jgi:hypothetical protein
MLMPTLLTFKLNGGMSDFERSHPEKRSLGFSAPTV